MGRRRDHAIESVLDRIEDRLIDAPEGLHQVGEPASADDLAAAAKAGLEPEVLALWRRWDGLDLGNGEARLLSLAEQAEATAAAATRLAIASPIPRLAPEMNMVFPASDIGSP